MLRSALGSHITHYHNIERIAFSGMNKSGVVPDYNAWPLTGGARISRGPISDDLRTEDLDY